MGLNIPKQALHHIPGWPEMVGIHQQMMLEGKRSPVCCSAFIAAFLQSKRVSDVPLWNTSTALPINNPACAPPENPGNGYLLPVYGPQDKLVAVRYKCYPPFTLIGSHQRVCQRDATWSGAVPICVKGAPPPFPNISFCMFIHQRCIS